MNLEDNKKAFMELLRIPSVTGSGADGEEKACAFLEHILQENGCLLYTSDAADD